MFTKAKWVALCVFIVLFGWSSMAQAHCEIPCGIYDDAMRIKLLREHVMTVEKSMRKIMELKAKTPLETNQLVRWINNKENHADKFQEIVCQYFLTQRIKLDADKYTTKLTVLHHMLIYAMKCKQTVDLDNVNKLNSLIDSFEELYFAKHEHE
jgi:nickel superoxide dismutase